MDFEEVREYCVGDDVRSIDWNVSAKMGKPFIKVFREERELTLMLVIDLSASGIFGSVQQSKREYAAEIAGVLAYSATLNNDKVGLILYTHQVEHYIAPKKGRSHILRLIRDLLFYQPQGRETNHRAALDYLNRVQKRKSVVFLISDFLQTNSDTFSKLSLTNQRHDLISIALTDPRESEVPDVGLITLEDAETGELIEVNTADSSVRKRYHNQAKQRRYLFHKQMLQNGLDYVQVGTDEPYLPTLRQLMARRASRH
tara:strand:+ start:5415 stop:6185 length:771 start_codon:yes stop_codon:yes gene_type:complete